MTEEEWYSLIDNLYKVVERQMIEKGTVYEEDLHWGESGETYDIQSDYLLVETYNAPEEVINLIKDYKDVDFFFGRD